MASTGGTKVNCGFYWSAQAWDMAMIPAERDRLAQIRIDRAHRRLPPSPHGFSFLFTLGCEAVGSLQLEGLLGQAAASYVVPGPQ